MKLPHLDKPQRLLAGLGYGAFALLALLVSLYLTFPADAVGRRLAHEIRVRTNGVYTLSFREISPYRLSGIHARDVQVRAMRAGQPPLDLRVDGVRARLRLLPLLLLRLSADVGVDLGDGSIDVRVTPEGDGDLTGSVELDKVNLASPPLVPRLLGVPVGGVIEGEAQTDWARDVGARSGRARIAIANATVGPGAVSGFTLPLTELGTLRPELVVEQGRLRVASFQQQGGQVQLKLAGAVSLRPQLETSQLELCLQLKPDPAYLRKNPNIETALQLAEVRFKRDPQGFLHIPLGGTLAAPLPRGGLCTGGGR